MKYTTKHIVSVDPTTGVALMHSSEHEGRPILFFSTGRHGISKCYMQYPIGVRMYAEPIAITTGGYSAVSVNEDLVLFAGDSGGCGITTSKVFRIDLISQTSSLVWEDTEDIIVRNGTFVSNSKDIVLVGCRKGGQLQNAICIYYSCITSSSGSVSWEVKWEHETCGDGAFAVGVASHSGITAMGNRICIRKYRQQHCDPMMSCIIRDECSASFNDCEDYFTNMQAVGCCIDYIIPNEVMLPDIIFVGSGHKQLRSQCFLIKGDTNERIDIGPPIDGRSVAVFDFTNNGLLDIFIVSVSDSHVLLLQHQPNVFETILVDNVIAQQGGEARGLAIGRLYYNDEVNVVITDASGEVANQIYSFTK